MNLKKLMIIISLIFIISIGGNIVFSDGTPEWIGIYKLNMTKEWVKENFPDATDEELKELFKEFASKGKKAILELKKDYKFKASFPDGEITGIIKDNGKNKDGYIDLTLMPLNKENVDEEIEPVTALYKDDMLIVIQEEFKLLFKKQS
jgi:hypothetical protein